MSNPTPKAKAMQLGDGTSLNLYSCKAKETAKQKAKAIIHINHGMCEHAGRYGPFMQFLSKHGYHSIAQDHRGHGKTTAKDAPLGTFAKTDGWEKIIEDAHAVNASSKNIFGELPIVVFGHSMGAAVALDYILTHPKTISGAAIWNGAMSGALPKVLSSILKIERALKGSDCASTWAKTLSFETWNKEFAPNRTPCDWLSRDEEEVDKYIIDPACGFDASIGMWLDLLGGLSKTANISRYQGLDTDLPFHILNGEKDPCSNKGGSAKQLQERLSKLGFTDTTKILLEGARHESLNELNRDQTMKDFVSWLDQRFN